MVVVRSRPHPRAESFNRSALQIRMQGVGGPSPSSVRFSSNTWIPQSNMPRYDSPDSKGHCRTQSHRGWVRIARTAFRTLDLGKEPRTVGLHNLYSVLITPTEVPRESNTATPTIQMLVSSPPPALPLLSIAARNFHQHSDNLNPPNVGRLVPWILPTFGSPENLVLTTTLTNPNPEMVPDPHGKSTLPSSHLPLLSLGGGHWGAYIYVPKGLYVTQSAGRHSPHWS